MPRFLTFPAFGLVVLTAVLRAGSAAGGPEFGEERFPLMRPAGGAETWGGTAVTVRARPQPEMGAAAGLLPRIRGTPAQLNHGPLRAQSLTPFAPGCPGNPPALVRRAPRD